MRKSSSRQFVGRDGVANQAFGPKFGVGISGKRPLTTVGLVMGTWLLGKYLPVVGSMGQFGKLPEFTGELAAGHTSLKFPVRSASVGTVVTLKKLDDGTTSRRHSSDQKKKVFCLFVL